MESEWQLLGQNGPVPASRVDLMTVLADIEQILVRASLGATTRASYLSDVTMDFAMDSLIFPGQLPADQVEMCRCPAGYRGSSCEVIPVVCPASLRLSDSSVFQRCDVGYYRDNSDATLSVLGTCRKCPCNNNEESCSQGYDLRVTCNCKPGYTGRNCDNVGECFQLRT